VHVLQNVITVVKFCYYTYFFEELVIYVSAMILYMLIIYVPNFVFMNAINTIEYHYCAFLFTIIMHRVNRLKK
jgi:hypothetical protein